MTTGHPEIDAEIINWYLGRGLKLTPLDKDNPDLTKRGKVPIYRSWPSKVVDFDRLLDRAHRGHNLGFVIPDHIAVLDIDPRNGGLPSLAKLTEAAGDFAAWHPVVVSGRGDGGIHVYGSIDANLRTLKTNKAELPGVDFIRRGGFVVIPGSWHYECGGRYHWDPESQWEDPIPAPWPKEIIDYFIAPGPTATRGEGSPSPCLNDEELAGLLDQLDAANYGDNDSWFQVMCACHHATNGLGVEPFVAWSLTDPQYAGHDSLIKDRWRSLSNKANSITYATLLKEIARKGGTVPAGIDFKIAQSYFADNPEVVDGFCVTPVAAAADDTRPTIVVDTNLPRMVEETVNLLPSMSIYQRDGQLTIIDDVEHRYNDEVQVKAAIRGVPRATLTTRLAAAARWVRVSRTKKGMSVTPVRPDRDTVDAVLEAREYPGTPCLVGIAESPFLRPDGSICQDDGYDQQTGFYLRLAHTSFPRIPETPTAAEAAEALAHLRDIFVDFPFITEADAYVPVASILTLLARPAVGNVPAFLVEASLRGTGKTLLCDTIGLIATGRVVPKFAWPRGREWQSELEKRLDSVARDGSALICWDDLKSRAAIGGTAFDSRVTANGSVKIRILGKSEAPELPWSTVMLINGNNIAGSVQAETKRRIMPCRMAPDIAKPETRSGFKHSDLLSYVREHRADAVSAGLTVLRYWTTIGRPELCETWGSFEAWAQMIPSAIVSAGGVDIMPARALVTEDAVDDEASDAAELLGVMATEWPLGVTAGELAAATLENERVKVAAVPVFGSGIVSKREMTFWLRRHTDQFFGSWQLRRDKDGREFVYSVREVK